MNRIAITGPESTGKSWLAEHLAGHFKTNWVREYAREYLGKINRPYVFDDIVLIAEGQLNLENEMSLKTEGVLLCDSDFLVTKVWSIFKFGRCDPWILEMVKHHRYDVYLLCDIDLPWEPDPLREHPDKRRILFDMYLEELESLKANYHIISGIGDNRLENAIYTVNEAFAKGEIEGNWL